MVGSMLVACASREAAITMLAPGSEPCDISLKSCTERIIEPFGRFLEELSHISYCTENVSVMYKRLSWEDQLLTTFLIAISNAQLGCQLRVSLHEAYACVARSVANPR